MSEPKFPSEEQGGYDPIPTHPEPNNPAHTTSHPEEEPDAGELSNDEGAKSLEDDGEISPR